MNKTLISLIFFLSFDNFYMLEARSQIISNIVVKVGETIVTSIDMKNQIITNLVLGKKEINQIAVNGNKNYALKNLINNSIKRNEINKYEIIDYNKSDLNSYISETAKSFNTNVNGLKEIFKKNNISYDLFVTHKETELLWNTLIFTMYANQINVNIIEVENEIKKVIDTNKYEYNLSEISITNSKDYKNKLIEILEVVNKLGFDVAAKKFSQSVSAKNGGLIGWVKDVYMPRNYLKKIQKLNVKEISKPILVDKSVLIIKLNEKKKYNSVNNNVDELKKKILSQKKQEKLNLFSRSHFSNLENTTIIDFQ